MTKYAEPEPLLLTSYEAMKRRASRFFLLANSSKRDTLEAAERTDLEWEEHHDNDPRGR